MQPKYDRTDFLDALFGEVCQRTGNFILVRKTTNLDRSGEFSYYPTIGSLGLARFPDDYHVLCGVYPRAKMKPELEHIRFANCIWATPDVGPSCYSGNSGHFHDEGEMREAVEGFPLKPSIIVHSGRGKHLYWLLRELMEITNPQALETLLSYFNKYFRCDSKVGIDSTLRLPETMNPRYREPPGSCYIEYLNPDLRYSGKDFRGINLLQGNVSAKQDLNANIAKPDTQRGLDEADTTDISERHTEFTQEQPQSATVNTSDSVARESPEVSTEIECLAILDERDSTPTGLTDQDLEKLAEKLALLLREQLVEKVAESISAEVIERTVQGISERLGLKGFGK